MVLKIELTIWFFVCYLLWCLLSPIFQKKYRFPLFSAETAVKPLLKLTLALIRLKFWFLDQMTSHAVQLILKFYLPAIGDLTCQNGGKTAVFLTLVLIMLEFWFLDTITSNAVQIILNSICPPLTVYPA